MLFLSTLLTYNSEDPEIGCCKSRGTDACWWGLTAGLKGCSTLTFPDMWSDSWCCVLAGCGPSTCLQVRGEHPDAPMDSSFHWNLSLKSMDGWKSLLKTRKIVEVGMKHTQALKLYRTQQNSTSLVRESFFTSMLSLCFVCDTEVNSSYTHSGWFSLEDGSPQMTVWIWSPDPLPAWLDCSHWPKESVPVEGNGNPLQCSCLANPMDRGA